jgi:hypothetical protein
MLKLRLNQRRKQRRKLQMTDIKRVIIVGAGGVGFWLTVSLMRDKPGLEVIVYDSDNFVGGFGSQRLPFVANKETKKVDFLRGFVKMAMKDEPPTVHPIRIDCDWIETMDMGDYWTNSLVVDASDMPLDARKPLWDSFRLRGAQMLRVSYDGNGIVVVARGLPFSTNPGGNYARVPTLAQSLWAAGVGAAAVEKLLAGEEVGDYQMELK